LQKKAPLGLAVLEFTRIDGDALDVEFKPALSFRDIDSIAHPRPRDGGMTGGVSFHDLSAITGALPGVYNVACPSCGSFAA
jgi:hypothetical protein